MAPEPTDELSMRTSALGTLRDDPTSRKRFLRMMGGGGAAGLALLLAACGDDEDTAATTSTADTASTPSTSTAEPSGGNGDLEIVNYALTLEYLEADFYKKVIESGVVKDPKIGALAMSILKNEEEHVDALKATAEMLGGPAAEKPETNFEEVIAGGPKMILATAAVVENLGAAAYLGQAAKIQSKDVLAAALSIHTVEARHAAALNSIAGNGFKGDEPLTGTIPDGPFAKPMSMEEVLEQVKPFLA